VFYWYAKNHSTPFGVGTRGVRHYHGINPVAKSFELLRSYPIFNACMYLICGVSNTHPTAQQFKWHSCGIYPTDWMPGRHDQPRLGLHNAYAFDRFRFIGSVKIIQPHSGLVYPECVVTTGFIPWLNHLNCFAVIPYSTHVCIWFVMHRICTQLRSSSNDIAVGFIPQKNAPRHHQPRQGLYMHPHTGVNFFNPSKEKLLNPIVNASHKKNFRPFFVGQKMAH